MDYVERGQRQGAGIVRTRLKVASDLAQRLESATASDRIEMLQRLVARITVGSDSLEIVVRGAALLGDTVIASEDAVTTSIVVPARLKRCGSAVRLIVRGLEEDKASGPDPRLLALLAKGQRWLSSLTSSRYPSVLAIARELGVATKEVTQVIYVAFLAPDIVHRIIEGEQPIGLGTKKLLSMMPPPLDWGEQRRVLGFDC